MKSDNLQESRSDKAWRMAREHAKKVAELMYPDEERRKRAEERIARIEYRKLMFPMSHLFGHLEER